MLPVIPFTRPPLAMRSSFRTPKRDLLALARHSFTSTFPFFTTSGPSRTRTSFFHFHLSFFHNICLKRHTAEVRYPEALLSASVLNVLTQQCGRHPALRCGTFSHSHVILSLPLFLFSPRPFQTSSLSNAVVLPHSEAGPSRTRTSFFHFHLSFFHNICLKRHTAEVRYPESIPQRPL